MTLPFFGKKKREREKKKKKPEGRKHNSGFVEAVIVILVLVLFLVIVGELSGLSQLSSRFVCGLCLCTVCVCFHVGLCSFR